MKSLLAVLVVAAIAVIAAGCANVSAPYIGTMTRVDQNIEKGNRGYLVGTAPEPGERKPTRQLITVDVDVPDRVSDNRVETFAGKPGITKTAEPGDVVPVNRPPRYETATSSADNSIVEVKREVSVVREETPAVIRETTVVTEEEIK
jgi:hypothetical protein